MSSRADVRAKMRVVVAEDVMLQIGIQRYIPIRGDYITIGEDYDPTPDAVEEAAVSPKRCQGCAIGLAFMSFLNIYDNWDKPNTDYVNSTDMRSLLRQAFSGPQLAMIEAAFEGILMTMEGNIKGLLAARSWFDTNVLRLGAEDRLLCIMWNIVQNKGSFTTKQRPDPEGARNHVAYLLHKLTHEKV